MKENITKRILSWDPDFTKLTPVERKRLILAEQEEMIPLDDIDWDDISEDEPLPDESELLKSWENENTDEYVSFDDIDWGE